MKLLNTLFYVFVIRLIAGGILPERFKIIPATIGSLCFSIIFIFSSFAISNMTMYFSIIVISFLVLNNITIKINPAIS